jgi:hypothetical protein
MTITRLKLFADGLFDSGEPEIAPDPSGAYVRYTDHLAALAAARDEGRREMKEAVYRICANVGEGTDIEDGEMVAMRISGLTAALPTKGVTP